MFGRQGLRLEGGGVEIGLVIGNAESDLVIGKVVAVGGLRGGDRFGDRERSCGWRVEG